MIHDFKERLDFSLQTSHEPFWNAIYKKAFPTMVDLKLVDNMEQQLMGIDRIVFLKNGKNILIDEKKRENVWKDILLEYVSNDITGTPGWIEKELAIDYVAYAFMPIQTVYFFQWDFLKRSWLHYKSTWLKNYKIVKAKNGNYTTYSVAIPIDILTKSISNASIIKS